MDAVKPHWASEDFATLAQRAKQINTIYGLLGETFEERTTEEWLTLLRKLGIPAAPLRTPDELFDNRHLQEVGFFQTVESSYGDLRFPGVPTGFSKTPGKVAGPAPLVGEDTQAILEELGLAGEAVATPANGA